VLKVVFSLLIFVVVAGAVVFHEFTALAAEHSPRTGAGWSYVQSLYVLLIFRQIPLSSE
jgi:hypothetical protein